MQIYQVLILITVSFLINRGETVCEGGGINCVVDSKIVELDANGNTLKAIYMITKTAGSLEVIQDSQATTFIAKFFSKSEATKKLYANGTINRDGSLHFNCDLATNNPNNPNNPSSGCKKRTPNFAIYIAVCFTLLATLWRGYPLKLLPLSILIFALAFAAIGVESQKNCSNSIDIVLTIPADSTITDGVLLCNSIDMIPSSCSKISTVQNCKDFSGCSMTPWKDDSTSCSSPSILRDNPDLITCISECTETACCKSDMPMWTQPFSKRVKKTDRALDPSGVVSSVMISAAKNELETFQIIINPPTVATTLYINMRSFPNLGTIQKIKIRKAKFGNDGWADELIPLTNANTTGGEVTMSLTEPTLLVFTVWIDENANAGMQTTSLTLNNHNIQVNLYVFDFAIPKAATFKTQMNIRISDPDPHSFKQMLFDYRHTPKSVPWPSGFKPGITWDNPDPKASADRCKKFIDEQYESDSYAIRSLGPKYVKGIDWNNVGFSSNMLFQFVSNSKPRPDTFCGEARGNGHDGTALYNQKWQQFLVALRDYLKTNGMLEKSYYYVQNEPQNAADEALAAHLCRIVKNVAPDLKIAVSEEPKASIANDANGACGYDIWISHIVPLSSALLYAQTRIKSFGEEVWFYSLEQDADPYPNPTQTNNPGIHSRIIPWVAWAVRATGYAYYAVGTPSNGGWWYNREPGIRAELFREGFEDYEYFYIANGRKHPTVDGTNPVDVTVKSIAQSLTSFLTDDKTLHDLVHQLGLKIEGNRADFPEAIVAPSVRPRGEYYLSFQDPEGDPKEDPLIQNGKTYMKIGWDAYDDKNHYGWSGENILKPNIALYGYSSDSSFTEVQRGFLYDDYGRQNNFKFDIENGKYSVEISVGWPGKTYNSKHNVLVEAIKVVDNKPTNAAPAVNGVITTTTEVIIKDAALDISIGGKDDAEQWSYTFLQYLNIVPIN